MMNARFADDKNNNVLSNSKKLEQKGSSKFYIDVLKT